MRKPALAGLLLAASFSVTQAQTLFTYGGKPVSKTEFLRIYQKNSLNKRPDFSEHALREYLNLYSLFRMKVTEAEKQHLDTSASIQRELENYRRQLSRNYLTDATVSDRLIHEAYDRLKEEVHVAHIMLQVPPNGDTVATYRLADSLYRVASKKGSDFNALAREFSTDRGSKQSGGDIGYITALQTIYPFENMAYSTPVGSVSKPFRTQFGYHILKSLGKRPARGEIQVAQIMVMSPKSRGEEGQAAARKTIDSAVTELRSGASWDSVVRKYSQDKYTVAEGGVMQPFGVGKMTPAFEEAAFALKKPGEISAPISTDYGMHLIKLVNRIPLKPFDSMVSDLRRRVEADSRAQTARDQYMAGVKARNGWKEYPASYDAILKQLETIPDTGKGANTFRASDFRNGSSPLFSIGGETYTVSEFGKFAENLTRGQIMGSRPVVLRDIYNMYAANVVNDFQLKNLDKENADFRNLMTEYRDGILLFDLMDRNVWGKASKDTVGLKNFYSANTAHYMWEPGFSGTIYKFKDRTTADQGAKLLAKGRIKDEDIQKALNTDAVPNGVTIQHGRWEWSRFTDVSRSSVVSGKASAPIANPDGSFMIVAAEKIYDSPGPKSLDEARGYAVAEYQDYLEKTWNESLRGQYPVSVDETVFKSMVK
jgi:peptidyl-prolyl cis-trans isomerase SurA